MALVEFIFKDFWHFIGALLLISLVLEGIAIIVREARSRRS
jgi:hypothetical protein